jgi:hypothetical protein
MTFFHCLWLLDLKITLVRPKLRYASVVWNTITCAVLSKHVTFQRNVATLCYSRFSVGICCSNYEGALA